MHWSTTLKDEVYVQDSMKNFGKVSYDTILIVFERQGQVDSLELPVNGGQKRLEMRRSDERHLVSGSYEQESRIAELEDIFESRRQILYWPR